MNTYIYGTYTRTTNENVLRVTNDKSKTIGKKVFATIEGNVTKYLHDNCGFENNLLIQKERKTWCMIAELARQFKVKAWWNSEVE